MRIYKKTKSFISLVCSIAILLSVFVTPVVAVDGKTVTATTNSSVKQGSSANCYVNIDSTESLASLEVTVHFDPAKVKINNVYNSIDCTLYDSVINTDNIQFSYILDGEGSVSQTGLFQFNYQVLGNAQVGDAYFDITIGEACDGDLKNVAVSGSRCKFTIAESITNKKCKIYSTRSLNTSIEHEFSLSYSFNTYEIASGSAVITYDPELFEVVEVANGEFLNNKLTDINTGFLGAVYISFVGTAYNSKYDFVTVKFKTLKNVDEASEITFKATELCNKELNTIACDNYITTANVLYDNTYVKDAPKISVTAQYDAIKEKVTATVLLEANSRLGAGDFVIGFNTDILTLSSYEKGFSPTFFNINDKEVAEGKLKFSIISLEDITDAQTVLTVVFDSSANCAKPRTDIDITGSMLSDSMTEPIALNFIGCDILFPTGHTYGKWVITQRPNCVDLGEMKKTCSTCGDVVTDVVEAYGHDYSSEWTVDIAPTCTEKGIKSRHCLACDDKTDVLEIDADGHKYETKWTIDTQPTCTEEGSKSHHCSVCGDKADVTVVPANGHNYGEWIVEIEPSCEEEGSKYKVCSVCDDVSFEVVDATGHNYSTEWTIDLAPTCTEKGVKSRHCLVCGDKTDVTIIMANGHNYGEWVVDNEPSCTEEGSQHKVCEVCYDYYVESIEAKGHVCNVEWIVESKPTEFESGLQYKDCIVCGVVLETEVIPQLLCEKPIMVSATIAGTSLVLSWESVNGADTYKLYRKTNSEWLLVAEIDGAQTSYIDASVSFDNVYTYYVTALNEAGESEHSNEMSLLHHAHTMGEWIERVPVTCTKNGENYRVCTVCDYQEIEIIKTPGHTFSDSWTIDVAETCTENGSKSRHCTVCDEKTDVTVIEASHKYSTEWTIDYPATCTTNGTKSHHCTVCDARTDITGIGATGHYYGEWIVDREADCTSSGSRHRICSSCADVVTETIKAKGHNYSTEWTVDVPNTCTTPGSKSHHCTACDAKTDVTTIAAAHEYEDFTTVDIERTCTTGGEISRHCKNCDARIDIVQTSPMGHRHENYTVVEKETCTETGEAISTCSYCGDVKRFTIQAKGHLYSNVFTIDVEATCTTDGSKSYHCIYCGDRKNIIVIPMKGHAYVWTDDFEQGVSVGVCGNCGDKKTERIEIDSVLTFKLNTASTGYIVSDCITDFSGRITIPAMYNGLPVLEIGASAFKDCSGITSVTIPEGVTKIGNQAFVNCSSLENVSIPSSATTWGTAVFRNCSSLKNINIPTELKTLGSATFYGCVSLEEIVLPEGMTSIGATSFRECSSLIKVKIPHSVTNIGNYAFYGCTMLETIEYSGDEFSWSSVKVGSNNAPLSSAEIVCIEFTHTMSTDAVIIEPTCVGEGRKIFSCIYCGKEVDEIIPATGIHEYSTDWTVDIESTCKDEGSKSRHCLNCEAKTDITSVPKAHVFSTEWTVDTAPTCTVDGSKSRHCTLCDEKTDVTAIAAAHKYSTEWTIDVEPKCAEDGSKSHHCTVCEDRTDITIIEAVGHNYVLTDVLSEHPHTITHTCSRCDDAIKEDNVISPCLECDYVVKTASNSHRLITYMGEETEVVIPAIYEGIPVTIIGNSCFRGNDNITSVEISEGIATIDSLAFMECPSLEKVYIPDSVTSIGTQAFYGFNGIVYCNSGSYAHKYAMDNNIKYVLQNTDEQENPIQETPYTQIDYDKSIIRTSLCASSDITEILNLSDSAVAVARASYVYGDLELYGTGTFITVFDGNEYVGDFLLVVDGDVNGDSICDAVDAFYVAQASNSLRELDDVYELAADSNADNIIDVIDYQAVINKAVS